MKQKEPTIQGSFGEILQPDVVPRHRIWTCAAVQLAVLIPLVFWSIQGDDPVLWCFCALTAVVFALYQGKLAMDNRRNRFLAFGVTPEKLTVLWDGQPVKTIPWDEVIEIFMICGPCEWHGKYAMDYGIYISLQYGYESRIYKAKRQILNLNISRDSIKHLEDFPVLRLFVSTDYKRCQRLLRRIEGYRNQARIQKYEEKKQ